MLLYAYLQGKDKNRVMYENSKIIDDIHNMEFSRPFTRKERENFKILSDDIHYPLILFTLVICNATFD